MTRPSVFWRGVLLAGTVLVGSATSGHAGIPTTRLPDHVLPALAGASRVAPATDADATSLTLTLTLRRDDQAAFEQQ